MPFTVYRADSREPEAINESGGFKGYKPPSLEQARNLAQHFFSGRDPKTKELVPLDLPDGASDAFDVAYKASVKNGNYGRLTLGDVVRIAKSEKSQSTIHVSTDLTTACGGYATGLDGKQKPNLTYKMEIPTDTLYTFQSQGMKALNRKPSSLLQGEIDPMQLGSANPTLIMDALDPKDATIIAIASNGNEVTFLTGIPDAWITEYRTQIRNPNQETTFSDWHQMPHAQQLQQQPIQQNINAPQVPLPNANAAQQLGQVHDDVQVDANGNDIANINVDPNAALNPIQNANPNVNPNINPNPNPNLDPNPNQHPIQQQIQADAIAQPQLDPNIALGQQQNAHAIPPNQLAQPLGNDILVNVPLQNVNAAQANDNPQRIVPDIVIDLPIPNANAMQGGDYAHPYQDPKHPYHSLHNQALHGLEKLGPNNCFNADDSSKLDAAAALVHAARGHKQPFDEIDNVIYAYRNQSHALYASSGDMELGSNKVAFVQGKHFQQEAVSPQDAQEDMQHHVKPSIKIEPQKSMMH